MADHSRDGRRYRGGACLGSLVWRLALPVSKTSATVQRARLLRLMAIEPAKEKWCVSRDQSHRWRNRAQIAGAGCG